MYQIISDGSCDLGEKVAKEQGIQVVPFYVSMDGENYKKEIQELGVRDFYQFMVDQPKVFPKTSLPSVDDYIKEFEPLVKQKIDIICICITTKFSGSYNSASNAKEILLETYPEAKIEIIDATVNTVLQGLLVLEAARMQKAGLSYENVIQNINTIKETGRIFFTIGSMEYLVHGGRVGKLTGLAASKLGIRPLIVLQDGEIQPAGIARGRNKSKEKVMELFIEYLQVQGYHPDDCVLTVGYGYDVEEAVEYRDAAQAKLLELYPDSKVDINIYQIGATIGVHTGPHPIGFGVLKRYDK